ncbi:cyclin-K [Onthophagus taurus]|uniref:cyclin-K n=1 Tax=Onthophagus taurus TaxID=166361 RepID=UPI000C20FCB0|nr:cyclin-K [Onthophagus taurus]
MPCWYYDKKELKNTPSSQDGIDYDMEVRYRKEGARFIMSLGTKMDLGYNTTATGVVYFHRFYMFHSFRQFPRYVTACCCLFLAGKVEETPKKCKDIIKTARGLLSDQKFAQFGADPKEEVMTLERILLQTIKFDLQVEHPYGYLIKYAKCLKGDKSKLEKMVQMAWTFVNDSLCTTLAIQWEPEIIAVALMYLAGKLSQFEVMDWTGRTPKHLRWWDMFVEDVTMDLLEDICHQVLDLYSQTSNQVPDSPPLAPRVPNQPQQLPPTPLKPTNGQEKTEPTPPPINPPPPDIPPPFPFGAMPPTEPYNPYPFAAPPIPAHIAPPPPGPPPPHIAAPPPIGVFPPFGGPPGHFPPPMPPNPPNNFYTPPPNTGAPPPNMRPPYYNS